MKVALGTRTLHKVSTTYRPFHGGLLELYLLSGTFEVSQKIISVREPTAMFKRDINEGVEVEMLLYPLY